EQAGELGKHSKLLRDLYERGADVKGETLIIPAEEFEVPGEQDHIRVISISHAFSKFRNDPKTAVEFHSLARAIAGETADTRTEIEVFKRYYDLIERDAQGRRLDRHGNDYERERAAAIDRTLSEMRLLAGEMAKLETRESIDIVPSITERSYVYRHIQDYERASEFYSLAQAIAGPEADLQRETQVFSYYYGKLEWDGDGHRLAPDNEAGKFEAVERTLAEMRHAVEQKAEIPEYAVATQAIVSFDEAPGRECSPDDNEEDSEIADEDKPLPGGASAVPMTMKKIPLLKIRLITKRTAMRTISTGRSTNTLLKKPMASAKRKQQPGNSTPPRARSISAASGCAFRQGLHPQPENG
ncbi:MAG TPA: hypothetical protein VFY40_06700, partial [Blastocatellia bacterium]|nr:hypothetical protein [Blastocatellia bacterium]